MRLPDIYPQWVPPFIQSWGLDWGDVPTWLAFLAAAIAGTFAFQALARERRRDERDESRKEAAQAAKVAAWFTWVVDTKGGPEDLRELSDDLPMHGYHPGDSSVRLMPKDLRLHLLNASDRPVYDVWVDLPYPVIQADRSVQTMSTSILSLIVLPPSAGAPRSHLVNELPNDHLETILRSIGGLKRVPAAAIAFTDSSGVKWKRTEVGVLARTD